uniref:Peptide-N(4)-(N-acetyl-beta-glucosaminyl)asparagine amidase n=1 Tax=Lutzomyia longipalpis TaxID=7200 RepID=A0A1B0CRQ6_LUTLO
MSSFIEKAVGNLAQKDVEKYRVSVGILLKLLDNVIGEPKNLKYRTIRLENKTIKEKLLVLDGMKDLLIALGFEEDSGCLTLSTKVLVGSLKKHRAIIQNSLEKVTRSEAESAASCSSQQKYQRPVFRKARKHAFNENLNVVRSSNAFLHGIVNRAQLVMSYEDEDLQEFGRQCIPIEKLKLQTQEKLRQIQKAIKAKTWKDPEPAFMDLLLVDFTEWFRSSFFTWINQLPCKVCKQTNGRSSVSVEDGIRVEELHCCSTVTRFYRYEDVATLLTTRMGRCGEYANCFTFLCRCLGYDARYVVATFDHVWTEVYSTTQKRWIHVDPSDSVVDAPLMYQHGWKRNVDYVIAHSKDDIQDVTWRYCNDHTQLLKRRTRCSEDELLRVIIKIRERKQKIAPKLRKYRVSVGILLKLLDNVIGEPKNLKYRTIRLENKTIKEKLLVLDGMKDLLIALGFEEDSGCLTLSTKVLVGSLKKHLTRSEAESAASCSSQQKYQRPVFRKARKHAFNENLNVVRSSNAFLHGIVNRAQLVMSYEDEDLQEFGRQCIPIEKLKLQTQEKLRQIQKAIKAKTWKDPEPAFMDLLLVDFTEWFRSSFFTWINQLPCKVCKQTNGRSSVSVEDGIRVEELHCCSTVTRFYRYEDVATLLTTRMGRCGEYANCFTFLCRCLGYDARYVVATFDHVWTEVYSPTQKRWIHVDPSDSVVDAPLMYQHGWKRNVDYVIAHSKDDIQDVTWRYCNDHTQLLKRRTRCSEDELLRVIIKIRERKQKDCTEAKKKYLAKRTLAEVIGFTVARKPNEDELKGRSSGSLAWKQSRGEQQSNSFFTFTATDLDKQHKQFNLRYSCSNDVYEKYIKSPQELQVIETFPSWNSCQYASHNIFRKVEHDWKMTYLARTEDTNEASIEWRFDFTAQNLSIASVFINFETKIYENGRISLLFMNENGEIVRDVQKLKNSRKFVMKAVLSGGKGDIAWQHTQLFRQPLKCPRYPFEICINFF